MSTKQAITKQGKYGTMYLYRIDYNDPIDPCFPITTTTQFAYSKEHVFDRWSESLNGDSFQIVNIALAVAQ